MSGVMILAILVTVASAVSLLHLGLFVVGANLYDVRRTYLNHRERVHNRMRRRRKYAPMISVVVPAHNEETGIIRTLDSLLKSSYRNMEVIVVDDGSTDKTALVTRRYINLLARAERAKAKTKTYMARSMRNGRLERRKVTPPARVKYEKVRLVRQKNGGKASAVNNGIQNYARGKLVMTLDADSMLREDAIANAVAYFRDRRIVGVAANVRIMGKGWLGTLQRFEHMIGYRSKKFYTLSNSEFIVGGVASTYRKSVLKRVGYYDTDTQTEDIGLSMKIISKLGNRTSHIIYGADVLAMTEGVLNYRGLIRQRYRWKLGSLQNMYKFRSLIFRGHDNKYSWMLTMYRLPVSLLGESLLMLEPFMLTFIIYTSIMHHSIAIFAGAYLTITFYTMWTIWPDEYMSIKQKIQMSCSAFGIYLLFYAMSLVQLLAIYKCLRNFRKIYNPRLGGSTWVSPDRSGTAQPVM